MVAEGRGEPSDEEMTASILRRVCGSPTREGATASPAGPTARCRGPDPCPFTPHRRPWSCSSSPVRTAHTHRSRRGYLPGSERRPRPSTSVRAALVLPWIWAPLIVVCFRNSVLKTSTCLGSTPAQFGVCKRVVVLNT